MVIASRILAASLSSIDRLQTRRTSNIDTQSTARVAIRIDSTCVDSPPIAGALRLRSFRPALGMQTGIRRGSRTPSLSALPLTTT
jgi:hypothetical protein